MFSLTSSEYSGGTRSPSLRPISSTRSDADEARELLVRVQDDVAMHEHRFVNAVRELAEQLRARVRCARCAGVAETRVIR